MRLPLRKVLAAVMAWGALGSSAGAAPPTVLGAETPQLLVERLNRALTLPSSESLREMLACFESKWRVEVASSALMVIRAMGAGVEKAVRERDARVAAAIRAGAPRAQVEKEFTVTLGDDRGRVDARKILEAYQALVAKHRLPPVDLGPHASEEALLAECRAIVIDKDQPALMVDLIGFLMLMPGMGPGDMSGSVGGVAWSRTETAGIRIQGDRGSLHRGKDRVELVREQGRWYLAGPPASAK